MTATVPIVKAKLVTVIIPYEYLESFTAALKRIGVHGYTTSSVDGQGLHGPRHRGMLDGSNVRVQILAMDELAMRVLDLAWKEHDGDGMVAYAVDVEAVARSTFQ